jgi:hypothetical protein
MTTVARDPVKEELDIMGMQKTDKAVDEVYGLGIGGVVVAGSRGSQHGELAVRQDRKLLFVFDGGEVRGVWDGGEEAYSFRGQQPG